MSTTPSTTIDKDRWVYSFGDGTAEGSADMADLLGGKGANIAEMSRIGVPVPPGFTITTSVCASYYANGKQLPADLKPLVNKAMKAVGEITGKTFGDKANPLLVSVRSGARVSMPGMMDTVLNLGLNDETVQGLAERSGDKRFAYDSYRRFIQMYADVVMGVDHHLFEDLLETYKNLEGYGSDTELDADDWLEVIKQYKECVETEIGSSFPQDPVEQLWGAIGAVFGSWNTARAITYRRLHMIPDDWGTAVNVQAMVFGNMGDDSATGVAFTRDPSNGENTLYGEFLVNAQGEDVVAGIRTPQVIAEAARTDRNPDRKSMETALPESFKELAEICHKLEQHYQDMQDIEFTIQEGKLWILQTRSGKRTARAALKIAVDMVDEGIINERQAVERIDPMAFDQLLHPTLDPDAPREVIGKGLPASPGAAAGVVTFSPDEAEKLGRQGKSVILVRIETSPEDVHGMHAAAGILTARGGMTSHAAVVARGMGRPCVSGAGALQIDYEEGTLRAGRTTVSEGDVITIDGTSGQVMLGKVPMRQPELSGDFAKLMEWADQFRRLSVRTNAETARDTLQAREFGAEGIGLCRTEHMFFDVSRISTIRRMILAEDEAGRREMLNEILPMQRGDFVELFEIMNGQPVTIRLLDPPLHEFLPHDEDGIKEVAETLEVDEKHLRRRVEELKEFNPMLGHRGCRLAISYPEICEMQARAIFEAAVLAAEKTGAPVLPEIMVPLVTGRGEFDYVKAIIDKMAAKVEEETGKKVDYQTGTMIELPRACFVADELAETAEFFSFGTNDLTQTVFGLSRDDAAPIVTSYSAAKLLEFDPFTSIDERGVGALVEIAAERGRKTRAGIKLGICGEHGGDPSSIHFCEKVGLDYVSCSPYRVPVARLAAAQAALSQKS